MILLKRNFKERGIHITGGNDDPKELVAVDLTIGDRYRVPEESGWFDLKTSYVLQPGRCALIKTQEQIQLPNNIFGSIYSRGSLSAKGLVVSNTKIDPLFTGVLQIPVFNAGRQSIKLEKGTRFCSAVFQTLEHPISGGIPRQPVEMDTREKRFFIDTFSEYFPLLITGLISVLASIGVTYITIKLTPPAQPQPSVSPSSQPKSS